MRPCLAAASTLGLGGRGSWGAVLVSADGDDGNDVEQWAADELQLVVVRSDRQRLMALLMRSPPLLRLHTDDDVNVPPLLVLTTVVTVTW